MINNIVFMLIPYYQTYLLVCTVHYTFALLSHS